MPPFVRGYIRTVDAVNYRIGRVMMYGIFVMVGILLWSSISKTFFLPSLWTLEIAQFAMVTYYILGGPYAIQMGSNVRMDLFYGEWSDKKKAQVDAITVMFLLFYLGVLLYGGLGSATYSLGYYGDGTLSFFADIIGPFITDLFTQGWDTASANWQDKLGPPERSATAWRPYMWPVKLLMCIGIFLMLLQAISEFLKDIAKIRGEDI